MVENKNLIDDERKSLHEAVQKVVPHLMDLKKEEDYIGYILLGSALVERQLVTTVKAHIHAFNTLALLSDLSTSKVFAYELTPSINKKITAGNALRYLSENFGFSENHSKLYKQTDDLINTRNSIAHKLVEQFGGDIKLANQELKSLADINTVENVFNAFTSLLNHISNDLADRFEEIGGIAQNEEENKK